MIKIENTQTYGWETAIRGMRNPMNSWDKSDTIIDDIGLVEIGKNDITLMQSLVKVGTDHRKFMRMITVTMDITAPLYWYKEMDTYKVGTVRNSCSTMHKIHAKEFELDDFSHEHLTTDNDVHCSVTGIDTLICLMADLNECREAYLKTKDKKYWWQMIQLLPNSYNQRATVMLNYEVLANIYKSRKNHKLDEWVEFCEWIETLPYSELITGEINAKAGTDNG